MVHIVTVTPRSTERSFKVAVRVSPAVHDFLRDEAENRGIALSSLCTHIIGEWKSVIDDRRRPSVMLGQQMEDMQNQVSDLFGTLPELLLADVEPPKPKIGNKK
jgi:hypothetical protein